MSTAANIVKNVVTIANGSTVSTTLELNRSLLCGLFLPTMTGATIQVKVSYDGNNFFPIKNTSGTDVYNAITASDDHYIPLDTLQTIGFPFINITSASAEGADREIVVITKQVA